MPRETLEDLDALVVRNIRDVEAAAYRVLHNIQKELKVAMDEMAADWAKEAGWDGEYDWWSDELWIAPSDWKSGEEWLGQFYLDVGVNDTCDLEPNEDLFWLTRLCAEGHGQLGFRWYLGSGMSMGQTKWKKFVREQHGLIEAIRKRGFILEDSGRFFTTLKVDSEAIASAIEDGAARESLKPMIDALNRVLSAKGDIDQLLRLAKKMEK